MISFKSVENFFEECTTGIEFKYEEKWYLIEFDDPFTCIGKVRIHLQDENSDSYFDDLRCEEFNDLEVAGASTCSSSSGKTIVRKPSPLTQRTYPE